MIFGKAILCVLIKMAAVSQKDSSAFYNCFSSKSSQIYLLAASAFYVSQDDKACFTESAQNYMIDLEDVTDAHVCIS